MKRDCTRSSATAERQRVSYTRLSRLSHWSCTSLNTASVVQIYNKLAKLVSTIDFRSHHDRERWRTQFSQQRQMFQDKLRQYWLTTINECRNDPKALWTKVQRLLSVPSFGHQSQLSAEDLSSHFVSKVDRIRTVTARAARPVINARMTSSMAAFQPVNPEEIRRIVTIMSTKHCVLDSVPTWLVKCSVDVPAPVFATICNASLESGKFPDMYKQVIVFPRLKKSTLDADDANSYRPISNLSFVSNLKATRKSRSCTVFRARGT